MFGIINSVVKLTTNVAEIAIAPVEIVVDIATVTTKPVADMAKSIKEEVKELTK